MKRCLAVLLAILLMSASVPIVSADIYNDDQFDWGEYACPHTVTEEVAAVPSTCFAQGHGAYTRCSDCKLLLAGSKEPLPLLDHSHELTEDMAPTCGADGYKVYTCHCGDSYTETIPATGAHVYDDVFDGECNDCGAIRDAIVLGDADGDGKANNRDLGILQRYLNEWDTEIVLIAVDLNGDGKINNRDLGLLQRLLNG